MIFSIVGILYVIFVSLYIYNFMHTRNQIKLLIKKNEQLLERKCPVNNSPDFKECKECEDDCKLFSKDQFKDI